jgi:hypothetical protein
MLRGASVAILALPSKSASLWMSTEPEGVQRQKVGQLRDVEYLRIWPQIRQLNPVSGRFDPLVHIEILVGV